MEHTSYQIHLDSTEKENLYSRATTRRILLSSELFLSHAEELFDIDAWEPTVWQTISADDDLANCTVLLDCANEMLENKRSQCDLAVDPLSEKRNCYDSLLSAAAAAANSAYEFSESLMEMGTCLVEKIAVTGDGENGKSLSMLGSVQLELQKLVDCYRSHIILTITNPSESLLSELRKVEEMKLQCDEKREVYEYMAKRGKGGKGENFTSQQLQAAREDYEETARLCIFRVQSLKQGQCRSLLTQAARHHGAQLNFFRKGLKSLEAVEPQIRTVAERQHIDYQPVELDDSEDGGKSYEPNDGELSFDYRQNKQELNDPFPLRDSMEFDPADAPSALTSGVEEVELDFGKAQEQVFTRQPRIVSHSAPIFAEKEKLDISERIKQAQTSVRKFHTYVLPTPADAKSSSTRTSVSLQHSSTANPSGGTNNPWHSSPLNMDNYSKFADGNLSTDALAKAQYTARETKDHNLFTPLPPPLAEGTSLPQHDIQNGIDARKIRRLAFSGPLASKPSSNKSLLSASGPIGLAERPLQEPGLASGIPITQPPSTLDVSYSASPPLVSSPRISELHELPRPPGSSKPSSSTAFGHSAPLGNRNREMSPTSRSPLLASNTGSPLPLPPLTIPRSFSIPSNDQRAMALHVAHLLESPQRKGKGDVMCSPPLTPISLANASNSGQIRGRS